MKQFRGTVHSRFLLQCPYTGNLTILPESEINKYLTRAFATTSDETLRIVHESIEFMISGIRFESSQRATAMALIAIASLEDMIRRIFDETNNMPILHINERPKSTKVKFPRRETVKCLKGTSNRMGRS